MNDVNAAKSRFNDKDELRYSLRSLEMYAPWIRHVYIVTNGQIPNWLDMDNQRMTLITHDDIFINQKHLPTFSSPAIETHIHNIPGLSDKFLYFNDDIFLGNEIWPEDFITQTGGQKIHLAWPVPDCSDVCPWIWVGDGSCDTVCNTTTCEYDGGDCNSTNHISDSQMINEDFDYPFKILENNNNKETLKLFELLKNKNTQTNNYFNTKISQLRKLKYINTSISSRHLKHSEKLKIKTNKRKKFNTTIKNNNNNNNSVVDKSKYKFKKIKEKNDDIINLINPNDMINKLKNKNNKKLNKKLDTYAESLLYVNHIFNSIYGFERRKVPAHMPHLIDRNIIIELQKKFNNEYYKTSSHRTRNSKDMQFAFTYFYYIISEKIIESTNKIFDVFDTDKSGTWSDREIRTLLTRMYDLPLDYGLVIDFESIILNCSRNIKLDDVNDVPSGERYLDSTLPIVTRNLINKCTGIVDKIKKFGEISKYHHEIIKAGKNEIFEMLTSNVSHTVQILDNIRRQPKKFICLNDDLDPDKKNENDIVRALLNDFYRALYPLRSSFELPAQYRNRFSNRHDLFEWRKSRVRARNILLLLVTILIFFTIYHIFHQTIKRFLRYKSFSTLNV